MSGIGLYYDLIFDDDEADAEFEEMTEQCLTCQKLYVDDKAGHCQELFEAPQWPCQRKVKVILH